MLIRVLARIGKRCHPVSQLKRPALRPRPTVRRRVPAKLQLLLTIALSTAAPTILGSPSSPLEWRWAYDDQGLVIGSEGPGGAKVSLAYERDDQGRMLGVKRSDSGGRTTEMRFDPFGRRTEMTDSEGAVTYRHDGFSRLVGVERAGMPLAAMTYDTLDHSDIPGHRGCSHLVPVRLPGAYGDYRHIGGKDRPFRDDDHDRLIATTQATMR